MVSPVQPPKPLLRVEIEQTRYLHIDERLAIHADGAAWYWSLAPRVEATGRVGTFAFQLSPADRASAERLAMELTALEPRSATGPREMPQVTIRAGARTHVYVPGADVVAPLVQAYALALRLMDEGGASPLSVLSLEIRPQPGWPRAGEPAQFAFLFQASGSGPVRFMLDRRSFWLGADAWTWQPVSDPAVGLMAAGGRHVDGIYAPAELAPGEMATLLFRRLPPFAAPGPVRLGARVEGSIWLAGPGAPGEPEPFRLTQLVEGVVGAP